MVMKTVTNLILKMRKKMANNTANPWSDIHTAGSGKVGARRADEKHNLDYFWGVDGTGKYLFFLQLHVSTAELPLFPKVGEIVISYTDGPEINDARLVFELKSKEHFEIFSVLCKDLMCSTVNAKNAKQALPVLIQRVSRWQRLLRRASGLLLTAAEIQGLFAELTYLLEYLVPAVGLLTALRGWNGPAGSPQDFCVGECAVEVKCKLGGTRNVIAVSSAEQLVANVPKLYLFVLTVAVADLRRPESQSLNDLVNRLKRMTGNEGGDALDLLESRLIDAGWLDLPEYMTPAFIVVDRRHYAVEDKFPKIIPSDLRNGVVDVHYGVELQECEQFVRETPWQRRNDEP